MSSSSPTAQQPTTPKLTLADFTARAEMFHAIRGFEDYSALLKHLGASFDLSSLPINLLVDLHTKKVLDESHYRDRTHHIFVEITKYLAASRDMADIEITAYFVAPYLEEFSASFAEILHEITSGVRERPASYTPDVDFFQTFYFVMRAGLAHGNRRVTRLVHLLQEHSQMTSSTVLDSARNAAPAATPPTHTPAAVETPAAN